MEDNGGGGVELQLQQQLHKLSCIESQEALEQMVCSLWSTRKTGLRPPDKSHLQSLLHLPSLSDLHPTILLLCFQKHGDSWKKEHISSSPQQDLLPGTSVSYPVTTNVPLSFPSLPSSAMSTSLWPRQDNDCRDFGISTPLVSDVNVSGLPPCFQCDIAPSENLENLPYLKSMTWTMENRGSSSADRVAIISLKLHDYSKSPLGETEVKFQLTRDTLEAMLRSMTYISEQLSAVATSSGPAKKKQKQ